MDIEKLKAEFEKLKYINEKLEYLNFDEHLGCYVEKNNGMPVGLAAWVNGAFYGFNQAAKAQAVPEQTLTSDCMINKLWFMKGTPVANLIKHAEEVYKAEVIAQNSKIKFGTDDNEVWWAHDVPYYGEVQMNWIKEDQEWDIFFNGCWQGPFDSKQECIKHLEECIAEQRAEAQEQSHE